MLSPHHPLKSPFINSSSEGELSDEYVVVGNQAKTGMQTKGVNTATTSVNGSKPEDSTSDNTDHHEGTAVAIPALAMSQVESTVAHKDKPQLQTLTAALTDDQNVVLSSHLEQVRRDLQSILDRLNSLEALMKRRQVSKTPVTVIHISNKTLYNLYI